MPSASFQTYGIVTVTSAAVTLTPGAHLGVRVVLNRAAGCTVTLPATSGSGARYEIILLADATGDHVIQVRNAVDVMMGWAALGNDSAGSSNFYTADTSDTITLNGTTKGGLKGARIVLDDVALGFWAVKVESEASGTEATPFSAAVS